MDSENLCKLYYSKEEEGPEMEETDKSQQQ